MKRVKETEFLRLEKKWLIFVMIVGVGMGILRRVINYMWFITLFFISETLLGEISDKSISQTYEEINIQ